MLLVWWDAEEGLIPFTACGTFRGVMGSCGTQIKAVCLGQSGNDPAGPDNRYFVGLRDLIQGPVPRYSYEVWGLVCSAGPGT